MKLRGIGHWPPRVEPEGNQVIKELYPEENGPVLFDVLHPAPRVYRLCQMGLIHIKCVALALLNDCPDEWDLFGIMYPTCILQFGDLINIKSLLHFE